MLAIPSSISAWVSGMMRSVERQYSTQFKRHLVASLVDGICQGWIIADHLVAIPLQAVLFNQPPGSGSDLFQIPILFGDIFARIGAFEDFEIVRSLSTP